MINIEDMSHGRQAVRQRWTSCKCGCLGQDSWHAATIKRVIHDVTAIAEPSQDKGYQDVAHGTYRHPSGERRTCRLQVYCFGDGRWARTGTWVWEGAR